MQEFSSVTASSYDAESLAPMLNDKAADGWSVVSIVAAGTNIVAYLQREAGDHDSAAAPATEDVLVDESTQEAPAEQTPQDSSVDETPADESSADAPFVPAAVPAADETPAPVDEPAGWATAPDDQTAEAPAEEASIADLAAQVGEPEPEPQAEPEPQPEPEPAAAPAAESTPAAESAVPAGWYADPSGRFELRYWDGTAWTEHVSRAGQQFTDPPVA
jgi:hypothetical protein